MEVNDELIKHVASAARIELTETEIKKFVPQIKEVLEYAKVLDEVDISNVKPSFQPIEIKDVMREDEITESLSQEDALKNAVHKKDGYFKGPSAL